MNYPIDLIKQYQAHEISRAKFCQSLGDLQRIGRVKSYADQSGCYILYRNRVAKVVKGHLIWYEVLQRFTAETIKEMKLKVDIEEIRRGT